MGSAAVAVILVFVLAYAWIDGGRQPVRPMAVPVRPEVLR